MKTIIIENQKYVFVKQVGNHYLFENRKTKTKTSFTLEQMCDINREFKKLVIERNMKNRKEYYECKMKNRKEELKNALKNKETNGERIYKYLLKHQNQTTKQLDEALNVGNPTKISQIIRQYNSQKIHENKQIYCIKKKVNNTGNKINIYYVEG